MIERGSELDRAGHRSSSASPAPCAGRAQPGTPEQSLQEAARPTANLHEPSPECDGVRGAGDVTPSNQLHSPPPISTSCRLFEAYRRSQTDLQASHFLTPTHRPPRGGIPPSTLPDPEVESRRSSLTRARPPFALALFARQPFPASLGQRREGP